MDIKRTPYRALLIGSIVLLVAYTAGWVLLLRGSVSNVVPDSEETMGGAGGRVYYRVVEASGEVHVLYAKENDSASVLIEAEQRFGRVREIKRISRSMAEELESRQASAILRQALGLLLLLPLAMLVAGVWLRRRTRQTELFWEAIRPRLGMDASRLAETTGLSDGALRAAMEGINRRGLAQLEWDSASNRIVDIRLSEHSIAVEYCERCNDPLNQRMRADLKQIPRCGNCMFQHDIDHLDKLKEPIVQQLHQQAAQVRESEGDQGFSLVIFGLLLLLFPPGAIAYAVRHW